jgi:hypothetical protein
MLAGGTDGHRPFSLGRLDWFATFLAVAMGPGIYATLRASDASYISAALVGVTLSAMCFRPVALKLALFGGSRATAPAAALRRGAVVEGLYTGLLLADWLLCLAFRRHLAAEVFGICLAVWCLKLPVYGLAYVRLRQQREELGTQVVPEALSPEHRRTMYLALAVLGAVMLCALLLVTFRVISPEVFVVTILLAAVCTGVGLGIKIGTSLARESRISADRPDDE